MRVGEATAAEEGTQILEKFPQMISASSRGEPEMSIWVKDYAEVNIDSHFEMKPNCGCYTAKTKHSDRGGAYRKLLVWEKV